MADTNNVCQRFVFVGGWRSGEGEAFTHAKFGNVRITIKNLSLAINSRRTMSTRYTILFLLISPLTGFSQAKPIQNFPLSDVKLLPSPFLDAQQTDLRYMLSLDP